MTDSVNNKNIVWDEQQQNILQSDYSQLFLYGAPGTGKTTIILEKIVQNINIHKHTESTLILSPTRTTATEIRSQIANKIIGTFTEIYSKTWSAYAFDILKRAQNSGKIPEMPGPPQLLSGAEQDAIIADILQGHKTLKSGPKWPKNLEKAINTRGFRKEIREMFDRIAERGISLEYLIHISQKNNKPHWLAVTQLYKEYNEILSLQSPVSYDTASLLRAAILVLKKDPQILLHESQRLSLIAIEDLQETNPAMLELLELISPNKKIIATICPDNTVQGFRGSRPDLIPQFIQKITTSNTENITLKTNYRNTDNIAEIWKKVADRIPAISGGKWRNFNTTNNLENTKPQNSYLEIVANDSDQQRLVAQKILHSHLYNKYEWSEIALIVRTGSQISFFKEYLESQNIPIKVPIAQLPIQTEPAVKPLLDILKISLQPELISIEIVESLLKSRIGGLDTLKLRKLKQALKLEEKATKGNRYSDELLLEAITNPEKIISLGTPGETALRIANMIQTTKKSLKEKQSTIEETLWKMFNASKLAPTWQKLAYQTNRISSQANQDLDAIIALLTVAARYTERRPGAGAKQFLEYILEQELPADTLAPKALTTQAVQIHTPATAASNQWPIVIIAGIQEKIWPNLRIRGDLLEVTQLVDILENQIRNQTALIKDIWFDELRTFSTSISRAQKQLFCIAVSSEKTQPSPFLKIINTSQILENKITSVEQNLNLREIVAQLRKKIQDPLASNTTKIDTAKLLAKLALEKTPGAHPNQWWGLLPLSSNTPVRNNDETISLSPSRIIQIQQCPLCWFTAEIQANPPSNISQHIGTMIHDIARIYQSTNINNLQEELTQQWEQLHLPPGWQNQKNLESAKKMLTLYTQYLQAMRQEERKLIGVEIDFSIQIGQAILRGQVDRLEINQNRELFIVDLKTGKSKPTKTEILQHPQLAAYQLAANQGAFSHILPDTNIQHTCGAALVQLGGNTAKVVIQNQEKISTEEKWVIEMINKSVNSISGSTIQAQHASNSQQRNTCKIPEICPLCPQGRQITQ